MAQRQRPGGSVNGDEVRANLRPVVIRSPNTLRRKVSRRPGLTRQEMAEAAGAELEALKADGLASIRNDVQHIAALYQAWVPGDADPVPALDALYRTTHELRGLGGTFGCDLVTMVARSLGTLIERTDPHHPRLHAAVGIHIDALKLVIDRAIAGDGGPPGRFLAIALAEMAEKIGGPEPPAPVRRCGNAPESAAAPSAERESRPAGEDGAEAADRLSEARTAVRVMTGS